MFESTTGRPARPVCSCQGRAVCVCAVPDTALPKFAAAVSGLLFVPAWTIGRGEESRRWVAGVADEHALVPVDPFGPGVDLCGCGRAAMVCPVRGLLEHLPGLWWHHQTGWLSAAARWAWRQAQC